MDICRIKNILKEGNTVVKYTSSYEQWGCMNQTGRNILGKHEKNKQVKGVNGISVRPWYLHVLSI